MENPYSSPMQNESGSQQAHSPKGDPKTVLTWQMVYVVLMTLLYSALTIGSLLMYIYAAEFAGPEDTPAEIRAAAVLIGIVSFGVLSPFVVGLFWRRGNGGWIFQIVLIAIGLSSCCTWPLTIPLIIGWVQHRDAIVNGR